VFSIVMSSTFGRFIRKEPKSALPQTSIVDSVQHTYQQDTSFSHDSVDLPQFTQRIRKVVQHIEGHHRVEHLGRKVQLFQAAQSHVQAQFPTCILTRRACHLHPHGLVPQRPSSLQKEAMAATDVKNPATFRQLMLEPSQVSLDVGMLVGPPLGDALRRRNARICLKIGFHGLVAQPRANVDQTTLCALHQPQELASKVERT